jgi:homoserine dehydrogenase
MVRADLVGEMLYYGRGAGRDPTASTVIADLADVVKHLAAGCPRTEPVPVRAGEAARVRPMSEVRTRHYLRLSLLDRPGVFARIATVLGKCNISIASVLQKEVRAGEYVPVVIVTHEAREALFEEALREIDAMDIVGDRTVRLRIED